ncbi:MBL fold metallo-hydrolase, partial [Clostridioides difficile]
MIIKKFVDSYFGVNTYVLGDEKTKKCAVIDPGGSLVETLSFVKENELNIEYIILTHGHGDHIGYVKDIKEKTGAKVVAHVDEKELLNDKNKNLSYTMRCGAQEFDADIYVNDKDKLELGELK